MEIDIFTNLRKLKRLPPEIKREISKRYGQRGERALRLVKERRVLKLGGKYWVLGETRAYRIDRAKGCDCTDYLRRRPPKMLGGWTGKMRMSPFFDRNHVPPECKHMIALRIAEAIGSVVVAPKGASIEDYLLGGEP